MGATARPDLAVDARDTVVREGLFHSLHRLLELPDDVKVMPGMWSCHCAVRHEPALSTIGYERALQPGAGPRHCRGVRGLWRATTTAAADMEHIVELNRGPFVERRRQADRSRRPLRR